MKLLVTILLTILTGCSMVGRRTSEYNPFTQERIETVRLVDGTFPNMYQPFTAQVDLRKTSPGDYSIVMLIRSLKDTIHTSEVIWLADWSRFTTKSSSQLLDVYIGRFDTAYTEQASMSVTYDQLKAMSEASDVQFRVYGRYEGPSIRLSPKAKEAMKAFLQ